MKSAWKLIPLLLPLLVGCVVASEGEEPWPEETDEQTSELDGVEMQAEYEPPTIPELSLPELSGTSTQIDETERPDPDPWQNTLSDDPVRPDPDPWTPPSNNQSGKGSSGAKD